MCVGYYTILDQMNSIEHRVNGLNSNIELVQWNMNNVQIAFPNLNASIQDLNATVEKLDLPALAANVSILENKTQIMNATLNEMSSSFENQTESMNDTLKGMHSEILTLNQTANEATVNLSMYNVSIWTSLLNWSQTFESSMTYNLSVWRNNLSPVWFPPPWTTLLSITTTMSKPLLVNISKFTKSDCGTALIQYGFSWSCTSACSTNRVRMHFYNAKTQNETFHTILSSPTSSFQFNDVVWVPLWNSSFVFLGELIGSPTFSLILLLTGCLLN
jgi:hypothetical protein